MHFEFLTMYRTCAKLKHHRKYGLCSIVRCVFTQINKKKLDIGRENSIFHKENLNINAKLHQSSGLQRKKLHRQLGQQSSG